MDSKLISVCLINDYPSISDLHIFDYGRAECRGEPFYIKYFFAKYEKQI